jgi:histidine ammonia-lyase
MTAPAAFDVVDIGPLPMTTEQLVRVAGGGARLRLSEDRAWRAKMAAGPERLQGLLDLGERVYGVTTGVGDSCVTTIPVADAAAMQLNLLRFHGCGTGALLSDEESAAVLVSRAASLCTGWSAMPLTILQALCDLVNHRILPRIPYEGSVGASGDLTPLSYVAATLVGERDVSDRGRLRPAREALDAAGLKPIQLRPKDALSLMNGTSVMTALACLALGRASRLARLTASLTAMASDVTRGNQSHFDDRLFAAKPHAGQRLCARWIREDIGYDSKAAREVQRVQDRYSIRCAPHVVGALLDAMPWIRQTLEVELNGANDNPLIDPETGDVLHGGNFYGGHIGLAMDTLKVAVASLADLMDRQMALICNPATNNGLPANLVARRGPDAILHHGFKAMQISTSALAAEALKLTMPATSFSRSTECHNQDKVSMGTIAARDCLRILELTETVAAIHLLALCQAVDIRSGEDCHTRSLSMHAAIRRIVPVNTEDRAMDGDIAGVLDALRTGALEVG